MNAVKIAIFTCVFISSACALSRAEDIKTVVDEFYGGLAAVIESNMESPGRCLREVSSYYKKNRKSVEKIRELTAKNMEETMAVKDKSAAITNEGPQAFDLMAFQRGVTAPDLTPGSAKYANALKKFTKKYPREGLELAGKTVQLLPGTETGR